MKDLYIKSKGQVLIIVAIALVVLLAIIGLALDLGIAYGVKAKLNAAVDAAAIAACMAKSNGADDTTVSNTAKNYFYANFPSGYLGATPSDPIIKSEINSGDWVVTVTASAVSPAYFAKVIGWNNFNIAAVGQASKPALDLALVLDTTSSLSTVFNDYWQNGQLLPGVKTQALTFINKFNETTDRVSLVPFADSVGFKPDGTLSDGVEINTSSPGFKKTDMKTAINNLPAGGNTASEVGMRVAIDQLNKVSVAAKHRVIVFFSDGQPNTFAGIFPLNPKGTVTKSGNLFSETWNPGPPHMLKHPDVTIDDNQYDLGKSLAYVPFNGGGNVMGGKTLALVSVDGNRKLVSDCGGDATCLKCNANKAARNMLENMAAIARKQGIVVYSLGFGDLLDKQDITNDCETWVDKGSTIMKRVANTKDSDTYDATQPSGLYCYAPDTTELGKCFNAIATAIMHLSK